MVDGKWPWESGEMPEATPAPSHERKDDMLYHLPKIKDRHTGRMRAMTVQEMLARKREEPEVSPHDW